MLVNDKVFVGCGSNTNLGDWWEYDISNDTWTQKADFPGNDRHHPYCFSIGDYAYVGFGHGSSPGRVVTLHRILIFIMIFIDIIQQMIVGSIS